MNQKTQDYLAGVRTWVEKNEGSVPDAKRVSQALEAAENAVREVDDLREKLAAATDEHRVTLLVLQETLKSAKHARKARDARDKADKKASRAKGKPDAKK